MKKSKKHSTIVILSMLFFLCINNTNAADRYWVGGTGDWNSTTHWSTVSGGAGGASIPTSSDNVIFNSNSAAANYTVNMIDALSCNDLTIGAPSSGKVNISYALPYKTLNIYGNLSIPAGISGFNYFSFSPYLKFNGTSGTKTISTNGVPMIIAGIIFNGGATYQLIDQLKIRDVQCTFSLVSGTFDANGQTVSILFTQWLILNGNLTFNTLDLSTISGEYMQLNSDITASVFSMNGYNTFSVTGFSKALRVLIKSNVATVQRTITASTVICKNVDFQDINGAGSGNWNLSSISGGSGDCDGNSGITFTSPKKLYWYRNTGLWSDTTKWFTLSNGGGIGNNYPLPQDTAVFDTASFTIVSQIVSENSPRIPTTKWISVRKLPQLDMLANAKLFGSLSIDSLLSVSNSGQFIFSRRNSSLTLRAENLVVNVNISVDAIGSTVSLSHNLNIVSTKYLSLLNGSFTDNNKNVSTGAFLSSNSNMRTLSMGTGTWTLTGRDITYYTWDITNSTNLTFSSSGILLINNTSLNLKTFAGGGLNYNILNLKGDNIVIKHNNTFNTINLDNQGLTRGIKFTSGTTQTLTNFTTSGSGPALSKILSTIAGSKFTLSKSSGTVSVDYLSIKDSEALGGATWNAGSNSSDLGGNSGWVF